MYNILITGHRNGLGAALYMALALEHHVIGYDILDGFDVCDPQIDGLDCIGLDILINCAGVNRIDWIEKFEESDWDGVMDVNAKGIFMMVKATLPLLIQSKGTVVNIVSNAAHMPMTCSTAYNASKAAAHIMTQQMARELTKKYGITVFGIAPNKLAGTEMSKYIEGRVTETRGWSAAQAAEYQRSALLTGEETSVEAVADFVAFLLSSKQRHKFLSGCVIPYGA